MINEESNELGPQYPTSDSDVPTANRKPILHFWRCFWLSFLVISLAYAGYCFYVPPNEIAWAEGYTVAQTKAAETEKPMILYFTGEWCVPCRIMKRQVWADPQVMAQINRHFIPVEIKVGDPNNVDLLERYNVKGSPVTIITDSFGNAQTWRAGKTGKTEFLEFLKEADSSGTKNS